jgi:hypothetical protein
MPDLRTTAETQSVQYQFTGLHLSPDATVCFMIGLVMVMMLLLEIRD